MSAAAAMSWRPVYDAGETMEQFARRQRQAFAAFELAWHEGRVSLKLKGYYDQLVRDVGTNAYAWWTEERWAEAFGVSASTIKRVLRALTTAGLIRRERQFGASSRTYLTSYDRVGIVVDVADLRDTDNQQLEHRTGTTPLSQHDITNSGGEEEHDQDQNQKPETSQDGMETHDYRQTSRPFFETSSDPTIGSLLHRDHVKTRKLTVGAAGTHPPTTMTDPLASQVLEREGVDTFVVAPLLAQHAAGELAAVSRYLDTQYAVRDRPRLFAWLVTHGFGGRLLTARGKRRAPGTHDRRRTRHVAPAPRVTPPPRQLPTAHAPAWAWVCAQLRTDGTAAELTPWLADTVLLELTDTAAVIGTPNVFVRDAVQVHATRLAIVLAQDGGQPVAVTVVVDGFFPG